MGTTEPEEWRSVMVGEATIEVSSLGHARTFDSVDAIGRRVRGRVLRPHLSGRYLRVRVSSSGVQTERALHHLVLEAFVGPRPEGLQGCHGDGNVRNNAVANLRWDTSKANNADKIEHGTIARGERNAAAELTESSVAFIKAAQGLGVGSNYLAIGFSVSRNAILRIKKQITWAHVAAASDDGIAEHCAEINKCAKARKVALWKLSNPQLSPMDQDKAAAEDAEQALRSALAVAIAWWERSGRNGATTWKT